MPLGIDPKSVAVGVLIGLFVVPFVTAKISAARAK